MTVKVVESNVKLIPTGEYTDQEFDDLVEEYRKANMASYPGATFSTTEDGSHLYLKGSDKVKLIRSKQKKD
ncbi:hypothetical protein HMPREF9372_1288 [Sporosarcina newyorkensis 2681]|uniref:Uncharacterized protein n=1 Tax=Sporosarcina newyorkensis 2681 TaxID=1027292 RepID=F9DR58_9BACL|nr:hypothetical protein [Sporosarcina newyorkensis]EGQ26747.1 hypothetical protein HMPREF9372_1288 [Sporosarcina newyorkensis 2681]